MIIFITLDRQHAKNKVWNVFVRRKHQRHYYTVANYVTPL